MEGARPVRAPRGTALTARTWSAEAPLPMLMNDLGPENAERPDDLGVIRHVDAGYEPAEQVAAARGVRMPVREGA